MASPWSSITVSKPPEHRGGGSGPQKKFRLQAASIAWSWGSEPATGTLVYVSSVPVTVGSVVRIEIAGHAFDGVCKSDTSKQSSKGHTRTLEFDDNRDFLSWDKVYGAFNLPDDPTVAGQRVKRYKHCLPHDFNARKWTYTTTPYSARQVLDF